MKTKIDVSNHGLLCNGEEVVEIEFDYNKLFKEGDIIQSDQGKVPLVIYNLKGGGRWILQATIKYIEND